MNTSMPVEMRQGVCVTGELDADLWSPISYEGASLPQVAEAKAACSDCVARVACREWAISTRQPDDIWGGMTPAERKPLWN